MAGESTHKLQYFQWIKGENATKVVEWNGDIIHDEHMGMNFLTFTDGSRVNEELLGDWIIKIDSPEDVILQDEFSKQSVSTNIQAPIVNQPIKHTQPNTTPQQNQSIVSPIHQLLSDSKKTKISINVSLLAESPPANLMAVLAETYKDGEDQILKYISTSIDIEDIKRQISKQIWLSAFEHKQPSTKKKKTNDAE